MTESLRNVRHELEEVCHMLLQPTPEVLDACMTRLAAALAQMQATRPEWPQLVEDCSAAVEARLVRRALSNVRRLLENSARFHSGWRRLRAALTGNYQADGSVAEGAMPRRIFLQG